jgi:hypothetical protein
MRQPDAAEQAETPIYCLRFVRVGGGGLMRWGWGALGIAKDAGVNIGARRGSKWKLAGS